MEWPTIPELGRALAHGHHVPTAFEISKGRAEALDQLVECRDCGLFQRLVDVPDGQVAACGRCRATLRRAHDNTAALVCTLAAAVLFVFAISMPFLSLRAAGRFTTGTLFTGPSLLSRLGHASVGTFVLLTLVIAPAVKLLVLGAGLWGERAPSPPRWVAWLFGWLERLGPWAMVDVCLLGIMVAYTRLRAIAHVELGPSLFALGGVMLTMVAADASLDRHAVWAALGRHAPGPFGLERGDLVGCHVCRLVSRGPDESRCRRCQHPLHRRKPRALARSCAFVLAAFALYFPANALPVMTVMRMGRGGPHTILGGVRELFEAKLWPLGIIVLLASVVIPLLKLGGLSVMLVMTHRGSAAFLLGRTRVFRVIGVIGRWSMIDIFALTTLVALVQMGFLATILPGDGALAFSAVVVLTMLSTEVFDPRLMWDAASAPRRARPSTMPHAELA